MVEADDERAVLVWEAPTRLFHWLLVAAVAAAYATERLNWMDWHAVAGDAALFLVSFRLIWGFVGGETARFAGFLASPRRALRHLARMGEREPDRQVGHNPAGGWMVLALLALVFAESLTGLYALDQIASEGALTPIVPASVANLIDSAHSWLWDVLVGAIALHVAAIVVYAAVKGQNLLKPMITGRKRLSPDAPSPRMASAARVALALAGGAAITAALAYVL